MATVADEVGVGILAAGVVARTLVVEIECYDFTHILKHGDGFIDGCQANHGVIHPHPGVDLFGAEVFLTADDGLENRHTLGGQAQTALPQFGDEIINAVLLVLHD